MQFSLSSLLGFSGVFAAFFITTGFAAMSMTKVSPTSFRVARFCFMATGIVPAITVWYAAIQSQVPYWGRGSIVILGSSAIGLVVGYLLRLVNENETAYSATRAEKEVVSDGRLELSYD